MVKNPPEGMPRVIPYLFYNDLTAATEWLSKVFGFAVSFALPGPDGKLMHAELAYEDGVVMMGAAKAEEGLRSPLDLKAVNQSLYIYVADVDEHCRKAREAGAQILMEPEEMFWGDRMYSARDLEGHSWSFAQHVKDIPPEEMKMPEDCAKA